MSTLKVLAAAAILTAPALFISMPANAITARQQALQGQGLYTTSKGVPEGYTGDYFAPQDDEADYDYRNDYRRRGPHSQQRYYDGY